MADRQVRIIISADVASAIRSMRDVESGLGRVGEAGQAAQKQTSTMGDVMKGALGAAGIQAGISGIVGGFKSLVSSGLDYERSSNTFQAVTQASTEQMKQMADTAKALGADIKIPGASAQGAAAAMTELAKGGLTAQQSMDAARGTMVLAAAAQIDGAQAAEIQANALNAFGLQADQAGRVANVLANVANKSSGEITDFSQGMAQSAAVAHMMGMSIEDTATALGLFANAGLKGSDAGTSLKTSMTALLNPSKDSQKAIDELGLTVKDSEGNFVGYRSIVEQLTAAKGRMTQMDFNAAAAQVLGTDAVRAGAIVAAGGTAAWDEMAGALGNVNGAADVAAANSKGLTGVIDALKNTVDTASLTLFESLQPSIMKVAEAATGLITPLAEGLSPVLSAVADTATNSLGPALQGLSGFISAVAGPVSSLVGWISGLPSPISAGVLALGAVIALRGPLTATFAGWTASGGTLLATLRGTAGAAAAGSAGLAGWIASLRAATGASATFGVVAKGALAVLGGPIGLAIIGVTTALTFFSSKTDDAAAATQDYTDVIDEQTGALKENAAQLISSKVEASGLGDKWRALGGDTSVLVDAIGKVPGAAEKANEFLTGVKQAAIDQGIALQGAAGAATDYTAATESAASTNVVSNLSFGAGTAALGTQSEGYKTATEAQDLFNQQTGLMNEALDTQKNTAAGTTGELGKVAGATTDAGAAAAPAAESVQDLAGALKVAAENADTLAKSTELTYMLGAAKGAADEAARALGLFKVKQDELTGGTRSLEDAQADQATTLAALQAAFKDGTAAATENSDAGNVNTQALTDWNVSALNATSDGAKLYGELRNMSDQHYATAAAAYSDAVAHGDVAGAADKARYQASLSRQEFVDLASQYLGGNVPAAEALATHLGILDGASIQDKDFEVIADDKQAQDALAAAQNAVIADKEFKIFAKAVISATDQATLDNANAQAVNHGYAATDYSAIVAAKADGGWVTAGTTPTADDVHIRVSKDEFIVRGSQAKKHAGLLEAINDGTMGFADGGPVSLAGDSSASAAVAVQGTVAVPDVGAIETAWAAISAAVQNAWAQVIQPTLDLLAAATAVTSADFLALQSDSVEPSWAANSDAISTAVNGTIIPTYTVLNAGTEFVGAEFQALFAGSVAPVWTNTGALIAATWAGPIAGTYAALNAGSNFVGSTFQLLSQTTASTWSAIGASINATYTGQIVPAWNGVQGFANSMGGFFSGLQTNVSASATSVTGDLGEITTAINDFFTLVDGKAPAAATSAAAATVAAGMPAFADGGPVTVGTTGRADDVLARVSKGEFIVKEDAAKKNLPALNAMNYHGAVLPAFADGGMVGGQLQSAVTAGAQKAIEAGVTQVLAAMAPTISGFSGPVPAGARGAFLNAVLSKQGTEYVWGEAGPDVFDCSGLMSWGLIQAGVGKGRLTAAEFGDNFPRVSAEKPGDMAIFDTGRVSPKAGHIGAVLDPNAGTMMHTDGAGPARISPYRGRSGLMGFIDAIGGDYSATPSAESKAGDPPAANWKQALLDKIKTGVTNGVAVGQGGTGAAAMNTVDPIQDFGAQNMARGNMSMVGPVPAGGAEERWRPMVEAILTMKGKPLGENTTRAMYQMHTESGGNPLAYNDYDRNYIDGHPSKSLWQTIPGTFRRWADPGFNTNIWHPESNFRAASNYVDANYGGIFPGRAYDNGGTVPPGFTMAYNGTGKDEMTLTNSQWQTARGALNGLGGSSGPLDIVITLNGDGALSDQIAQTARVVVNGALVQTARVMTTSMGQGL